MISSTMTDLQTTDMPMGKTRKDELWKRDYILVCLSSFLTSFSFFLLVPTLPFYLKDTYQISQSMVGFVLSCYVLSVLCIRPFAGFLSDTLPRKRVYNIAYTMFALAFTGYFGFASSLALFIVLRIFHGFAFGCLSTSTNTLVIDVMPSSRRGEGLGYFGVMNNLAMAIGPMVGLMIISDMNFTLLFSCSLTSALTGLVISYIVHSPHREPKKEQKRVLSLDRFFLTKGIPASFSLFFLAIPNAMTSSYMALYAKSVGIVRNAGLFFTIMAAGMIISRLSSGKQVDRGKVTETIAKGIFIVFFGVLGETLLNASSVISLGLAYCVYYLSAFLLGYGFGTMFPAFNTLFINLAPNSLRATANATYLTGWDVGIGCGMFLGGILTEHSFVLCFGVCMALVICSYTFFKRKVTPHFNIHRLR